MYRVSKIQSALYADNFYAWYNGRRYLLAVAMGGTRYIQSSVSSTYSNLQSWKIRKQVKGDMDSTISCVILKHSSLRDRIKFYNNLSGLQ